MKRRNGFSLIELLITVVIILVIAAISIPNFMRSRMAANEANAVGSLHSINTSEAVYSNTYGSGYSSNLASLGGSCPLTTPPTSSAACLLDNVLAADPASKSGYTITYTAGSGANSYTVAANPITAGATAITYLFTDQTSVIRGDTAAPATASSSPI